MIIVVNNKAKQKQILWLQQYSVERDLTCLLYWAEEGSGRPLPAPFQGLHSWEALGPPVQL